MSLLWSCSGLLRPRKMQCPLVSPPSLSLNTRNLPLLPAIKTSRIPIAIWCCRLHLGPYKREGDSTIFYLRPNETHARPMSPSSLRALSPEWAAGGAINSAFKASSLGRGEEGTTQEYHIKSLYKLNFCFFSWDEVQPTTLHTILAACILCYYCCACYYCGQGGDIEWSFLVPLSSMLYLWRQDLDFSNKTRDRERERYGPLHDRANHHSLEPTLARVPFYSKFRNFEILNTTDE